MTQPKVRRRLLHAGLPTGVYGLLVALNYSAPRKKKKGPSSWRSLQSSFNILRERELTARLSAAEEGSTLDQQEKQGILSNSSCGVMSATNSRLQVSD